MNISDLLAKYGDDRVEMQSLDQCTERLNYSKGITKITFGTPQALDPHGTKKMGLVVWLDRDEVQRLRDEKQRRIDNEPDPEAQTAEQRGYERGLRDAAALCEAEIETANENLAGYNTTVSENVWIGRKVAAEELRGKIRTLSPSEADPVGEAARVLLREWTEHGEGLVGELSCWSMSSSGLEPDIDGEWVRFSDVKSALSALAGEEG